VLEKDLAGLEDQMLGSIQINPWLQGIKRTKPNRNNSLHLPHHLQAATADTTPIMAGVIQLPPEFLRAATTHVSAGTTKMKIFHSILCFHVFV
jgi:hypothetical protein